MRIGRTSHVCPSCGMVGTADQTICSQCGHLTAMKITTTTERDEKHRGNRA
jgi:uncharacterized OB-fold protein